MTIRISRNERVCIDSDRIARKSKPPAGAAVIVSQVPSVKLAMLCIVEGKALCDKLLAQKTGWHHTRMFEYDKAGAYDYRNWHMADSRSEVALISEPLVNASYSRQSPRP